MAEQIGGAVYVLNLDSSEFMTGAQAAEAMKQRIVASYRQVDTAALSTAKSTTTAGTAAKSASKDFEVLGLTTTNFARQATAAALGVGALSVGAQVLRGVFGGTITAAS